ncbi:MAG: hypothetical protein GXO69_02125 [Acidobacteria bacterium]|nr:hypothetical protein [Acidobacteriota bacterium]
MDFETIIFEKRENIAIVTINRPKVLNALNRTVLDELEMVIDAIASDPSVQGAVVTGAGEKAFVAGADISEFRGISVEEARKMSRRGQMIFARLESLPIPVIAAVNGFALGGGLELAMSCTFRYALPHAKVGQPEVKLGLIPGYGGTQRLARLAGRSKAMEICMTARMVGAEEALKIGIIDRIIEDGNLVDAAVESIQAILANAPLAVAYCKQAVLDGLELPFDAAEKLESRLFGLCFATEDKDEGVSAFLEKRAAEFKGK